MKEANTFKRIISVFFLNRSQVTKWIKMLLHIFFTMRFILARPRIEMSIQLFWYQMHSCLHICNILGCAKISNGSSCLLTCFLQYMYKIVMVNIFRIYSTIIIKISNETLRLCYWISRPLKYIDIKLESYLFVP